MYVEFKKFVIGILKEKEVKPYSLTESSVRDVEREMENGEVKKTKEPITVAYVMEVLKRIQQLKENFSGDDWRAIEKEAAKMIK